MENVRAGMKEFELVAEVQRANKKDNFITFRFKQF